MPRSFRLALLCCWIGLSAPARSEDAVGKRKADGDAKAGAPAGPDHAIVAGFERLADEPKVDPVHLGPILLGELNCTSCHREGDALDASIDRKQAPILDRVGARVRPGFLRAFVADPQGTKPGTTMPNLLAAYPEGERKEIAEALAQFLATTGRIADKVPQKKAIGAGRTLYHEVGCVACHGPRDGQGPRLAASVPLPDLSAKYTVPSLSGFLRDPHAVRPSGRMPSLNLTNEEAEAVASYLMKDLRARMHPNLDYAYYEGTWKDLPDFGKLKPRASGDIHGFDISLARRKDDFGIRFKGFLRIEREGEYTFFLSSDDGSRLSLDGHPVVDNDGTHAPQEKSGSVRLGKGVHPLMVDFFEASNGEELEVEFEGPDLHRQPLSPFVFLRESEAKEGKAETSEGTKPDDSDFTPDPALAERGRGLFASIGCASCHVLQQRGKAIPTKTSARALAALGPRGGCLDPAAPKGLPRYELDGRQRSALAAALASFANPPTRPPGAKELVVRTMTAFNCYACHRRGDLGGVEPTRDPSFATTQPEMGDEGRLPPSLEGVGAKLNASYLTRIVANGLKDRPYMLTRMPKFGEANVGHLVAAFESLDAGSIPPADPVTFDLAPQKVKAAGRFIVGSQALNCVACHTFKDIKAQGIQAIDMTTMTLRLRRDWFHKYLPDPPALRPGTRMPTGWPMGQSMLPNVLDGDTRKQVEAVWAYLSDGRNAPVPIGLVRNPIPLVPETEAILYRNFIEGAGSRAIGVGYPEKAHVAFDAESPRLALAWQGPFIDASRHWTDRGVGFQPPLGDLVTSLPPGPAFATLRSPSDVWPTEPSPGLVPRFLGYRLSGPARKPTFLYEFGPIHVEDRPDAVAGKEAGTIRRTLVLTAPGPVEQAWFRVAVGSKIEPAADGWFSVEGAWKTRLRGDSRPVVRSSQGKAELLVPVKLAKGRETIEQEIAW